MEAVSGRCPSNGHEIYTNDEDPPATRFSCECPLRADGFYAKAFGIFLMRQAHPNGQKGVEHVWKEADRA